MGAHQKLSRSVTGIGNSESLAHRVSHHISSDEQCPDQQRDELVPRKEPIVPAPVCTETNRRQHGVVADKRHVPNGMKEIAVDRGLRDIEHAHQDEHRIVARAVPLKAAQVFFRFR